MRGGQGEVPVSTLLSHEPSEWACPGKDVKDADTGRWHAQANVRTCPSHVSGHLRLRAVVRAATVNS